MMNRKELKHMRQLVKARIPLQNFHAVRLLTYSENRTRQMDRLEQIIRWYESYCKELKQKLGERKDKA